MSTQRIIYAGLGGGVVYFLLGWLFYGILLADFFASNAGSAIGVNREMDEMLMWSILLGNLLFGFLLAIILGSWAKVKSIGDGVKKAAIIGLLMTAAVDFTMYGTSNLMTLGGSIGDIITSVVITSIVGLVVAWILSKEKQTSE
ncbi:MAG TPA: hypothetical protein VKA27_16215 [Sunxiuqinia sp.]|nr:hypothetical protein [Sunxiuqinia sp.]